MEQPTSKPIVFKALPALAWYFRQRGLSLAAELIEIPCRDHELLGRLKRIPEQFWVGNIDLPTVAQGVDLVERSFRRREHGQEEFHSIWETRLRKLQPEIRAWVLGLPQVPDREWALDGSRSAPHLKVYTCARGGVELELSALSRDYETTYSFKGHEIDTKARVQAATGVAAKALVFAQRAALDPAQLDAVRAFAGLDPAA